MKMAWVATLAGAAIAFVGMGVTSQFSLANTSTTTIGSLRIDPSTGNANTVIALLTSGPCTDPNATNIQATLDGSGFPSGTHVVGNSSITAYQSEANGGYYIPLSQSLRDYANEQSPPATFSGTYTLTVTCRRNTGLAEYGNFVGHLTFNSDHTTYVAEDPPGFPTAPPPPTVTPSPSTSLPPPQQTNISISFNPTKPLAGRPATIIFTVSAASGTPAGQIRFSDRWGGGGIPNSPPYGAFDQILDLVNGKASVNLRLETGPHEMSLYFDSANWSLFQPNSIYTRILVPAETKLEAKPIVDMSAPSTWDVRARLIELVSERPIQYGIVRFTYGSTLLCTAVTDTFGYATCPINKPAAAPASYLLGWQANFAGAFNGLFLPAAPSKANLLVTVPPTAKASAR